MPAFDFFQPNPEIMRRQVRHAGWVFPVGKKDAVSNTPVCASLRNGMLSVAKIVCLRGVIDLTHEDSEVEALDSLAFMKGLRLVFYTDSGTVRNMTIRCSCSEERAAWVNAISKTISMNSRDTTRPLGEPKVSSYDFDSMNKMSEADEKLMRTSTSASLEALVKAASSGSLATSTDSGGGDGGSSYSSSRRSNLSSSAAPSHHKKKTESNKNHRAKCFPCITAILEKSKSIKGQRNAKPSGFQERIFCLENGTLSYYSFSLVCEPIAMRRCRLELRERKKYKSGKRGQRPPAGNDKPQSNNSNPDICLDTTDTQSTDVSEKVGVGSKGRSASNQVVDQHWFELIVVPADEKRVSLICGSDAQRQTWISFVNKACEETLKLAEEDKDREVYVVAKAWMYKKGKSVWSSWKRRFFVFLSTREVWYYESDVSASVKGHIQLDVATAIRAATMPDAPQPHCFEIVTPSRTWKICPDVDSSGDVAVTRWLLLLNSSAAYERVQQRGTTRRRKSLPVKSLQSGDSSDQPPEHTKPLTVSESKSGDSINGTSRGVLSGSIGEGEDIDSVGIVHTTAYQRLSGNVHVSVLSQSPWSAREIAFSLMET